MDITPVEIRYYQTVAKRRPFEDWLETLDAANRSRVDARLVRLSRGLHGDVEPVGEGVFEIKLDIGPGYRIYFGREGRVIVILLNAGDKKTQSSDIRTAQQFWKDYLARREK